MKEHIYLSVGGAGSSRNILQTVKWVENENKQEALLDLLDAIYDKGFFCIKVDVLTAHVPHQIALFLSLRTQKRPLDS
jgi:hypothetical protein